MRICQVGTGSLPIVPGVAGGAERFVHYLAKGLQTRGHEVTVVDATASPRGDTPYRLVEEPPRARAGANPLDRVARGLLFGRAVAKRLACLLREESFDVVNFHSQFSGLLGIPVARRLGVPAFFTMHNPLWSDEAACRSPWARAAFWMERRAEVQADALIYLSEAVKENRRCFFGLPGGKFRVVPLGIDESWFTRRRASAAVRRKYAPNGEAVLLQVARLAPYKNQIALVKALREVVREAPSVRAVLVGPVDSPDYLRMLRREVAAAGLEEKVVFAGSVPPEELAQLYALASVFVLPSLRENCPQALLEAMAQGLAVVASDIAPLRPILEGVASLVPPLEPDSLAKEVLALLADRKARERLANQVRRRAWARHRWELIAGQTADVYQTWIPATPRAAGRASQRSLMEGGP